MTDKNTKFPVLLRTRGIFVLKQTLKSDSKKQYRGLGCFNIELSPPSPRLDSLTQLP